MHISRTFMRFCIVGTANTSVDTGMFLLLTAMQWDIFAANLVSTSLGLICSFILNARYTFRRDQYSLRQVVSFIIYTGLGLWALQPSIIWLLTTAFGLPLLAAKLAAIGVVLTWNYYWYRNRVFRTA